MSLILIIDTSGENAFVCLSKEGNLIAKKESMQQNQHASFVHVAIAELFNDVDFKLNNIDAVAVVNGPGSYTGLRVGLATAKGICFALNKPIILINTLYIMATAIRNLYVENNEIKGNELFCPLIDARRAEVFTGIYDIDLKVVMNNTNLIIEQNSFADYLSNHFIAFGGNACNKVEQILNTPNASYYQSISYIQEACKEADKQFKDNNFDSLIYSEPFYLKEFYSISPKKTTDTIL
ncbi:MAG: tRNA (adenosine(37)-N6)-threonylcarbamoyltransferase complex dimerization subunit type 1 TsaB [Bacteroidota bacterium]